MSKAHDTDGVRPVQPKMTQLPTNFMPPNPAGASGEFPLYGRFSTGRWATMLECSRKTVERNIELHSIPHKRVGDTIIIDADDYWNALPIQKPVKRKKRE